MQSLVEYFILGSLLVWSGYVVVRRFLPAASFRGQQALAYWLARQQFHLLSRWVMPKLPSGCANGCSGCSPAQSACATSTTPKAEEKPVRWQT